MKSKTSRPGKRPATPGSPARRPARTGGQGSHPITSGELNRLQDSLRNLQQALDAIRRGQAEAAMGNSAVGNPGCNPPPAEQPYRIYVERMQEGAVTVSAEGEILYGNRRFAEMLGQPLERVIHGSLIRYLSEDVWRRLKVVFDEGEEVVKFETTLRSSVDSGRPVHLTASRLSVDGPPIMCLVVTDLSAQKEKEDLRLAKEVAERSSAAKDDFLAALSHELRTPLTPALMAATVLEKDTGLPETARSDISLIRRNIELEARLIDDLLDLTLITHGKLSLQTDEINLHTSLNRAIEVCQGDARLKRLNMQIELNARQTMIIGDPVRVQQVCWNVLRNAVKFTAERGTISIVTGNDDHQNVWVRVTDTGIGFTHEQATRIFEPFEQGDRHVIRQFGGLGLGLAITRSIMHAHGGGIEGTSPGLNQGATFTLRFPLAKAIARKPEKPAVRLPANPGGLNILLVDDHKDTRVCIQRLLEAQGHRVTSAGTGQDALNLAEAGRFDLIISDLGLPDLSGHELMHRLHTRFNLPGIALSGYGMEADLAHSREAGFKYHLTKPVSFDRLKSFVAEFAANREAVPEAAAPV
ncbi:MAG TPA: ATP-binding protein [Lacunisphaera sp.]|nr:ATP-binding protein [Lacunisphaera sp.]